VDDAARRAVKLGPVRPVANGPLPRASCSWSAPGAGRHGDHAGALGEVRAAGKKPMPATDWARGLRISRGERFE
jgi:methionyl-tRNA formyltransferase